MGGRDTTMDIVSDTHLTAARTADLHGQDEFTVYEREGLSLADILH